MAFLALSTVYDPSGYLGTAETDAENTITAWFDVSGTKAEMPIDGMGWNADKVIESYFSRGVWTPVDQPVVVEFAALEPDARSVTYPAGDVLGLG